MGMKKTEGVFFRGSGRSLNLLQITGLVTFSETKGNALRIKIENSVSKELEIDCSDLPANIYVGSIIRGFYLDKHKNQAVIPLKAYELMDGNRNILTRGAEQGYEFIED